MCMISTKNNAFKKKKKKQLLFIEYLIFRIEINNAASGTLQRPGERDAHRRVVIISPRSIHTDLCVNARRYRHRFFSQTVMFFH